jgi:hypothetical protein
VPARLPLYISFKAREDIENQRCQACYCGVRQILASCADLGLLWFQWSYISVWCNVDEQFCGSSLRSADLRHGGRLGLLRFQLSYALEKSISREEHDTTQRNTTHHNTRTTHPSGCRRSVERSLPPHRCRSAFQRRHCCHCCCCHRRCRCRGFGAPMTSRTVCLVWEWRDEIGISIPYLKPLL